MSSKHAPGPWVAYEIAPDDPEWGACEIWPDENDREDEEGTVKPVATMVMGVENARLIAAAPDLLMRLTGLIAAAEYLQARVVETRGANCMDNLDVAIDEARAAIAKATGGAQ